MRRMLLTFVIIMALLAAEVVAISYYPTMFYIPVIAFIVICVLLVCAMKGRRRKRR
jgi:hypothetical protein